MKQYTLASRPVPVAITIPASPYTAGMLRLGRQDTADYWNGLIIDPFVYTRELSADEMSELHRLGTEALL